MSDELSIRQNQKSKQEGQPSPRSYDANVDDVGEASWEVAEKEQPEVESNQGFPGFGGEEEEEKAKPSSFDVGRIISGIKSRLKLVILIAVVFSVLGFAFASTKNSYKWVTSTSLVLHEHQNVFKVADTKGFRTQKYKMKTLLAAVELPSVLQGAADRAGLDVSGGAIGQALEVESEEKNKLITFTITWSDPEQAAAIANGLALSFIEKNKQMRKADSLTALGFYSRQLEQTRERSAKGELEIIAFKEKFAVVDVDTGTENRLKVVASLHEQHRGILAELDAIVASKKLMRGKVVGLEEFVVEGVSYSNPLDARLKELELRLGDAKGRYTDINPKIIEMKDAIKKVKAMIATGEYDVEENSYITNPLKHTMLKRLHELDEEFKVGSIKADALKAMANEMEADIKRLNQHSAQFYKMRSKQDAAKNLMSKLQSRVEDLQLVLGSEESDFDVVEQAPVPTVHLPNKKKTIQMMGIIGGVVAGLLVAVILELKDPTVRTVKEVAGLFPETEFLFEFQQVPSFETVVIDSAYPKDKVAVIFRRMLNEFCIQVEREDRQTLAFISVERGAGKSTILTNFAESLARKEEPVLIVDSDFAIGGGSTSGDLLGVERVGGGLLSVLAGTTSKLSDVIQQTKTKAVRFASASGKDHLSESAVFWLARKRMTSLVEQLKNYRGNVLYDLSPLQEHEPSFEAAVAIGHAVFIVHSGQTKKSEVKVLAERLTVAGVQVHAVFITDVPERFMRNGLQYEYIGGEKNVKNT